MIEKISSVITSVLIVFIALCCVALAVCLVLKTFQNFNQGYFVGGAAGVVLISAIIWFAVRIKSRSEEIT